jgi:hypothetical protein
MLMACAVLAACTAKSTAAPPAAGPSPAGATGATGTTGTTGTTGATGTPSTAAGTPAASTAAVAVPCSQVIGRQGAPPADMTVLLGAVALPVKQVLQASDAGSEAPVQLFAKWGLVVRAGADVTVRLGAGAPSRARIGWGSAAAPQQAVHVSCPAPTGPAQWLAFAGGYWVDQPACVPVEVTTGGRTATANISVGVKCP